MTISASEGNSSDKPAPMTSPPMITVTRFGASATITRPTASTIADQKATSRGPSRSGTLPMNGRTPM
jgi:hypothetical protein